MKTSLVKRLLIYVISSFTLLSFLLIAIGFFILNHYLYEEFIHDNKSLTKEVSNHIRFVVKTKNNKVLKDEIKKVSSYNDIEYVLLSNDKKIIVHSFETLPKLLIKDLTLNDTQIQFVTLKNKKLVNISSQVSNSNLYIHIGFKKDYLYQLLKKSILILFASVVVLLLLVSLVFLLIFKKIRNKILLLVNYAEFLKQHDFKVASRQQAIIQESLEKKQDELSLLGYTFINLEKSLIDKINEIKETTYAKNKMENEIHFAGEIQQNMLPKKDDLVIIDHLKIFQYLKSAKEISGDFFDYHLLNDDHLLFVVGDVSGKGLPASLHMASAITYIKGISQHYHDPSDIITITNEQLCKTNKSMHFITLFCGILTLSSGKIEYVNAGHPKPYIINKKSKLTELPTTNGIALGVEKNYYFQSLSYQLKNEDQLFIFTDGINEAMNNKKELFGEKRIKESLTKDTKNITSRGDKLLEDLNKFTKSTIPNDDITLLGIEWKAKEVEITDQFGIHFSNKLSEIKKLETVLNTFHNANSSISRKTILNMNLILEELITNTINYGYEDHFDHKIKLFLRLDKNQLHAQIEDDGIPFNPVEFDVSIDNDSIETAAIGGLGIRFIKKLASSIDYKRKDNHNIVFISLDIET